LYGSTCGDILTKLEISGWLASYEFNGNIIAICPSCRNELNKGE